MLIKTNIMGFLFLLHREVALVVINSNKWEEAMRNETPDLATGLRTTPMRKLIKKMPGEYR